MRRFTRLALPIFTALAGVGLLTAITSPASASLPNGESCGVRSTFDWNAQADGQAPLPFTVDGVTGTTSLLEPLDASSLFAVQNDGFQLGTSTGHLRIATDGTDGNRVAWSLGFSQPVFDLQLDALDVDRFDWQDILEVRAFNGSTEIHDVSFEPRFAVAQVSTNSPTFAGLSPATNNSRAGNIAIGVAGPVTRLEFVYIDGFGPSGQHIGIGDPSWCTAQIGLSHRLLSGPTHNPDGTQQTTFRLRLENLGGHPLSDLQLRESLASFGVPGVAPFAADQYSVTATIVANTTDPLTLNPGFDGGSDVDVIDTSAGGTLDVGETATIDISVHSRVDLGSGPRNLATSAAASGDPAFAANGVADGTTSDISDDGHETDPNQNGLPDEPTEDDPTNVLFDNTLIPVSSENPSVAVTKHAPTYTDTDLSGSQNIGDRLTYAIDVVNTGDVALSGVSLVDSIATVDCAGITTLAIGATLTCSATYDLANLNVGRGYVRNAAIVTASSPEGIVVSDRDENFHPVFPDYGLFVDKTVPVIDDTNLSGHVDAGDIATFEILVRNDFTSDVLSLVVDDLLAGQADCGIQPVLVSIGSSVLCTIDIPITQAMLNDGRMSNTAIAMDATPNRLMVGADNVQVPLTQITTLDISESSSAIVDLNGSGASDPGDSFTYQFQVTNTGNVTLDSLTIAGMPGGALTCLTTTLAPGDSTTCETDYVLTQADFDAGAVTATFDTSAQGPTAAVADQRTVAMVIPSSPSLAVTHDLPTTDTGGFALDDRLEYAVTVTNTGNVTLNNVTVTDLLTGTLLCTFDVLAPGSTSSCVAQYVVTAADVTRRSVNNVATATADPSVGTSVAASASSSVEVLASATDDVPVDTAGSTGSTSTTQTPGRIARTGTESGRLLSPALAMMTLGTLMLGAAASMTQQRLAATGRGPSDC